MEDIQQRGEKRKSVELDQGEQKRRQVCVVHHPSSKCGPFTYLRNVKNPKERLDMLKSIRDRRLSQTVGSPNRMEEACKLIPEDIADVHGYHRDCYQMFTNHLNRLSESSKEAVPSTSRNARSSSSRIVFTPDCIFCKKEGPKSVKTKGYWTTESTSMFEFGGWQSVVEKAEKIGDEQLLLRIRGVDLFAAEARYHKSCRRSYVAGYKVSGNKEEKDRQQQMEEVHLEAFASVCTIVDEEIFKNSRIMKLSELNEQYKESLKQTQFANPKYRPSKLKSKLENCDAYKGKLSFCEVDGKGKFASYLVYSSQIGVEKAIQSMYDLNSSDTISDVAISLRSSITNAFEESEELPWPSTADALASRQDKLPEDLEKFLNLLLAGTHSHVSTRVSRLVQSIGQDICRAATNGQWKMTKHIFLCMTLRHLFRSAQLITLMNRFGHSESYSFSLELETAIGQALQQSSSLLSRQIVCDPAEPTLFHSDFDNFDQFVSSLTGSGSIHTAHGIMMQEVSSGAARDSNDPDPPLLRTKERSLAIQHENALPPCYVNRKACPDFRVRHWKENDGEEAFGQSSKKNLLWIFTRKSSSDREQEVPGWAGFVSSTGDAPESLTTVDYYPVINHPITDLSTVQECLRAAEEASHEVGQEIVITTFDLGVCMKAYPILWSNPARYKNHIVLIGTFHVLCAYFKMLGKKMEGSGLQDILIESGLMTSGSMKGVMTGKNYERSLHCHKTMLECLERLLVEEFLSVNGKNSLLSDIPETSRRTFENLIQSQTGETLSRVMDDVHVVSMVVAYESFKSEVRKGSLGKTAQLWLSYMDCVWIALSLIRSVKENNFSLYLHCLFVMPDLFFTFGGHNYSRYLTYLAVFLTNIEDSHPGALPLLKNGAISVARSFIPGSRCHVDKTIEETIMKHGKSRGGAGSGIGLSGITQNYNAYQRWARTSTERARFLSATLSLADMTSDTGQGTKHRDQRPSEIRKGESSVKKAISAVKSFLNPFDVDDKTGLYVLSSGARVPADVEKDVLNAITVGKEQKEKFISERLEKKAGFFDPIRNLKLKTMAVTNKTVKLKTSERKLVEYKQQGDIAFQLMVKAQLSGGQLNLREIMKFSLTPVPYSLGTSDNFFAKTDKSKGLHYLLRDVDNAQPPMSMSSKTLVVEDGNAVFYYLKEVPSNFKDISRKIFKLMSGNTDVVFSTDMYKVNSVKASERTRRGTSEKRIIKGVMTKKPSDWKHFLSNEENKKQLISVLLQVWSEDDMAKDLVGRKVIFVKEDKAILLTSKNGKKTLATQVSELKSDQEETDSRVVLYCKYAKDQGFENVNVKSPDSDIFFILLHHVHHLPGIRLFLETGKSTKQRIIDVSDFAHKSSPEYCSALLGLHAFSGCDSTSAFKGMGKVKPIKLMQQRNKFIKPLAELGESWTVSSDLLSALEEFTCALYGKPRITDVDEVRYLMMKERCKGDGEEITGSVHVDLSSFPPCKDSLEQHIRRANYQVGIWKRALENNPVIPCPTQGHGWTKNGDVIVPLWSTKDILPPRLVDVLESVEEESDDEDIYQTDDCVESDHDTDSDDDSVW